MSELPRYAAVCLPILRAAPALAGVKIGTWGEDIDYRTFPMINLRRLGGTRDQWHPTLFAQPVIEMTAYGNVGLVETEQLYEDALEALYEAVRRQTLTPSGYLTSIRETLGATQFSSPFQDSWRIQGLIKLGQRPLRSP